MSGHERVWSERAAAAEARVEQLEAQVAGLERMNTEKAAVIRRLQRGNHPAGRALPHLALAEALTERDAEHEGGGGALCLNPDCGQPRGHLGVCD